MLDCCAVQSLKQLSTTSTETLHYLQLQLEQITAKETQRQNTQPFLCCNQMDFYKKFQSYYVCVLTGQQSDITVAVSTASMMRRR